MELVLYAAAGAALGALYFALLRRTASRYVAGAAALPTVSLHLARIAAAAAAFWAIAARGALPLLLALGGFLIARAWALRRAGGG